MPVGVSMFVVAGIGLRWEWRLVFKFQCASWVLCVLFIACLFCYTVRFFVAVVAAPVTFYFAVGRWYFPFFLDRQ